MDVFRFRNAATAITFSISKITWIKTDPVDGKMANL